MFQSFDGFAWYNLFKHSHSVLEGLGTIERMFKQQSSQIAKFWVETVIFETTQQFRSAL